MLNLSRPLVGISLLICSSISFAEVTAKSFIDLLKATPATITGQIEFDKPVEVQKKIFGVNVASAKIKEKQGIGIEFSENHLKIMPDDSIAISITGLPAPVTISQLYWDESHQKFSVKLKSWIPKVPGTRSAVSFLEKNYNEQVEAYLNGPESIYKAKMIKAFQELKKIRASQNMNDVTLIAQAIASIFSDSSQKEVLPTIHGELSINLQPEKDEKFTFGDWKAEVKKNDNFALAVKFEKKPQKVLIHGLELSSKAGIRFSGKTSVPEIASLVAFDLNLQESGPDIRYSIGAEEVIAGYQQVIGLFGTISGRPISPENCDCKEFKLTPIRETINKDLRFQLSKFVKAYRETLLEKGISPELIRALE